MAATPWVVRAEHTKARAEFIKRYATKAEALLAAKNIVVKGFQVDFPDGNSLLTTPAQVEIISVYYEPDSTLVG